MWALESIRLTRSSQNNETKHLLNYSHISDRLSSRAKPTLGWLKTQKPQYFLNRSLLHIREARPPSRCSFLLCTNSNVVVTNNLRHKLFHRCPIASISTRTTIEARAYLSTSEGQTHRADLDTENYLHWVMRAQVQR